jgi:hypothetical protein
VIGDVVGVRVHVDEAGRHDQPRRVHDLAGLGPPDRADRNDAAVLDGDIGTAARRPGAVHDRAAGDQEIVPVCLNAQQGGGERERRDDAHERSREFVDGRPILLAVPRKASGMSCGL